MSLEGKIAVVTGASRGIGKAISLMLAREGVDIACVATRESNAQGIRDEIKALGRRALAIGARVEIGAQVATLFEQVEAGLGPLDILVNNAGSGASFKL